MEIVSTAASIAMRVRMAGSSQAQGSDLNFDEMAPITGEPELQVDVGDLDLSISHESDLLNDFDFQEFITTQLAEILWPVYVFIINTSAWIVGEAHDMDIVTLVAGPLWELNQAIVNLISWSTISIFLGISVLICSLWVYSGRAWRGVVQGAIGFIIAVFVAGNVVATDFSDNGFWGTYSGYIPNVSEENGSNAGEDRSNIIELAEMLVKEYVKAGGDVQVEYGEGADQYEYLVQVPNDMITLVPPEHQYRNSLLFVPYQILNYKEILTPECQKLLVAALAAAGRDPQAMRLITPEGEKGELNDFETQYGTEGENTVGDYIPDWVEDDIIWAGQGNPCDDVEGAECDEYFDNLLNPGRMSANVEVPQLVGLCQHSDAENGGIGYYSDMADGELIQHLLLMIVAGILLGVLVIIMAAQLFGNVFFFLIELVRLTVTSLIAIIPGAPRATLWRNIGGLLAAALAVFVNVVFFYIVISIITTYLGEPVAAETNSAAMAMGGGASGAGGGEIAAATDTADDYTNKMMVLVVFVFFIMVGWKKVTDALNQIGGRISGAFSKKFDSGADFHHAGPSATPMGAISAFTSGVNTVGDATSKFGIRPWSAVGNIRRRLVRGGGRIAGRIVRGNARRMGRIPGKIGDKVEEVAKKRRSPYPTGGDPASTTPRVGENTRITNVRQRGTQTNRIADNFQGRRAGAAAAAQDRATPQPPTGPIGETPSTPGMTTRAASPNSSTSGPPAIPRSAGDGTEGRPHPTPPNQPRPPGNPSPAAFTDGDAPAPRSVPPAASQQPTANPEIEARRRAHERLQRALGTPEYDDDDPPPGT